LLNSSAMTTVDYRTVPAGGLSGLPLSPALISGLLLRLPL